MRSQQLLLASLLFGLLPGCGGCGSNGPADDSFDGNVIIGDASRSGGDARVESGIDAQDTGADTGLTDVEDGDDLGPDATAGDAGDAGIACAPDPARTVTATTAVTDRAALAGLVLEVVGTATVTGSTCGGACDGGGCNCSCDALVAIDGVLPLVSSPCFDRPGCHGDGCTLVCRPAVLGFPQRFLGRLTVTNGGAGAALEILSVLP